ncbi:efflux RND transporter permease subunit [Tuwongella immobilis]|uniref:SSD domain-containing protein n=1 Tax=Tuwongella immobilis TaxID=692036 RepID=A0A6C2YVI2_9BACT|nr:efflux RND transporter permease subunit [Tuwongella immobilis]VIP05758.1 rnd transporter : Acriflavin resistance protein OS=Planctomyces limnophilus (strain ATCC 43296 / DSM 3776 / IFAM 1008 / 290) GN=Plim_0559 PE=4 SV=1: ACR_tran [Tuwongella immobilis]VTS08872.1 rnd transporter : Acriflavin resistance protein OS=Planctomyces limnophilus (strain ATCC 43296 / DSM 3776 / IFAM 1008 / 290) GN=Plim_0559 PE=4 SV=1: ACR_tran [Tuwongella immobilis]
MSIWDICIRRPVFTVMLVSAPIILGLVAYSRLGLELFPNADVPVAVVTTTLRGASVEEMEFSVTKPLEDVINTVSGIDELRSTTREGVSEIVVQFKISKNGDVGAQEIDSKIRTILNQLPEGVDTPIINKIAMDAIPVMTVAISGKRDFREMTEITKKQIKEVIETLPGVGTVAMVGGRQRAVQIYLDPERMFKYPDLTVEDIRMALVRENQELPGGRVTRGISERGLRTLGRVEEPRELEKLIVCNRNNTPIRLEEIGRVEDTVEEPRSVSRLWVRNADDTNLEEPGENAISLIIQKQSGANTVAVSHAIKAELERLLPGLPPDLRAEVIRDQARFVEASLDEVKTHLLLAAVLVSLSILLFLRDWRTTIIATLSIPTSIVGTFALMYGMGFSINSMTMLGLILAVGIVVDDAVVVHENIFRHMEEKGLSAWEAAASATREIALAVTATTLSLVVIFAPIAFMGGTVGRFLSCFGWVVGFAVMLSLAVSFTLTPMLCSRFLKPIEGHNTKDSFIWRTIENSYLAILGWSLRHRWLVVLGSVLFLFSTPMIAGLVGSNFVPKDDQNEFEIVATLPEDTSLQRADAITADIERRLRMLPGLQLTYAIIGDTTANVTKARGEVTKLTIYCRILPLDRRNYSQFDVMEQARVIMADYPDLRSTVQAAEAIQAAGFKQVDIDLNLSGPDMKELEVVSQKIVEYMKQTPGYIDIDTSLSQRKPELRVIPDRERLSDLGVSLASLATTTSILVGGEPVSKYKDGDEQIDIWLRAEEWARGETDVIGRMGVPASTAPDHAVRLDSIATLTEAIGPSSINRFRRQRQIVVNANLQGKGLSEAVVELQAFVKTLNLPPAYRAEFLGDAKMMQESNDNFLLGFMLAFIFMYMILAAQFESFSHPVSILSALPLTIPCALLSLLAMQTMLDLYAMLGLFMLFGIVKKNGILQVDTANQLRAAGMAREPAIMEANRMRLRPILMTTVMLIAAMVPMAIAEGPGAASRASMAKVILGGQTFSLLLTLIVTPVAYSILDGWGQWFARQFRGKPKAATPDSAPAHSAGMNPGPAATPPTWASATNGSPASVGSAGFGGSTATGGNPPSAPPPS